MQVTETERAARPSTREQPFRCIVHQGRLVAWLLGCCRACGAVIRKTTNKNTESEIIKAFVSRFGLAVTR